MQFLNADWVLTFKGLLKGHSPNIVQFLARDSI